MKILSVLFTFVLIVFACYWYLFHSQQGARLLGNLGVTLDEYYNFSDEDSSHFQDLKLNYSLNPKKDSSIILYYKPSFNAEYKVILQKDSMIICKRICLKEAQDPNIFLGMRYCLQDGFDTLKKNRNVSKGNSTYYLELNKLINTKMKSIRVKEAVCFDGADIIVEIHKGAEFSVFSMWVTKYNNKRYMKIQKIVVDILLITGCVDKQEFVDYGFTF